MDENKDAYIDYKEYVDSFIRISKENLDSMPIVPDKPDSDSQPGDDVDMGD